MHGLKSLAASAASALFGACLLAPSAGSASTVVWEQLPDANVAAVIDQEFGDFPSFSTYLVNDAQIGGSSYRLDSMTAWFTNNKGGSWTAVSSARLNIFPTNGSGQPANATDNPEAGTLVTVSASIDGNGFVEMFANLSGLNLILAPGSYWFGLTPLADFSTLGQEFHLNSARVGRDTFGRIPGGGFVGLGMDWLEASDINSASVGFDAAFRLMGTEIVTDDPPGPASVPEPATLALVWSGLAAALMRRRVARCG